MKEELFTLLKKHMLEIVIPHHKALLRGDNEDTCKYVERDVTQNSEVKAILQKIVKKAAESPEKVCTFLFHETELCKR